MASQRCCHRWIYSGHRWLVWSYRRKLSLNTNSQLTVVIISNKWSLRFSNAVGVIKVLTLVLYVLPSNRLPITTDILQYQHNWLCSSWRRHQVYSWPRSKFPWFFCRHHRRRFRCCKSSCQGELCVWRMVQFIQHGQRNQGKSFILVPWPCWLQLETCQNNPMGRCSFTRNCCCSIHAL